MKADKLMTNLKKLMMSGLTDTSWQTNDHLIHLMISSLKDNTLANKWSAINAQISDWWSADIWQPDDNYQLTIAVKTSWWSYSMTIDHWPANKNIKHIKQAFDQLTNSWLTNKQITNFQAKSPAYKPVWMWWPADKPELSTHQPDD